MGENHALGPCKPSFATVTGWGIDPNHALLEIKTILKNMMQRSVNDQNFNPLFLHFNLCHMGGPSWRITVISLDRVPRTWLNFPFTIIAEMHH